MKHTISVTIALLVFFVAAQVFGLFLINKDSIIILEDSKIKVTHENTAMGERPQTEGFGSVLYLFIGIAIGTVLLLILAKFKKTNLWRVWFFIAVWIALSISLGVFIKGKILFDYDVAMLLAAAFTTWKIFRPNILIHNITEVLVYSGIALLLVPIFELRGAIVMLLAIAAYDAYAVWKSKHMVRIAKFQTESKVFAGLMIPYKNASPESEQESKTSQRFESAKKLSKKDKTILQKENRQKNKNTKDDTQSSDNSINKPKNAILGGGDIAFPLIFEGVVMEGLIMQGLSKSAAFLHSSIIIITTTIALGLLFLLAKKDRFYPAMPFITAGCLIGWVIVMII
jgi:presenilin-like A22 family membrane protease